MARKFSFLRRLILPFIGVLLIGIVLFMQPWRIGGLHSDPKPVQNYAQAVQQIQQLDAKEAALLNPVCRVQFFTHNKKVARAIIMVHGYTSCPHQFFELGEQFYDMGYNVLIAPMPYHGYKDRMTDAHSHLTAEDLANYADQVVDIAQGLGDHVTMMGLSVGGLVTAWAAQTRADIDLAVVISPTFGYEVIPTAATAAAMNAFLLLPNDYDWWNPMAQEKGGVPHGYPRYSKRALAQALRLGFAVEKKAKKQAPKASILLITNASDHEVNNERTAEIAKLWRENGAKLLTYEFPEDLHLPHDLIEPLNQQSEIRKAYPKIKQLVNSYH